MWDKLALILLVVGGINWGLVGIFDLDLVAWTLGGAGSIAARAVYSISFLFRRNEELAVSADRH